MDEWEQLKAEAAKGPSTHMLLNQLAPAGGGGGESTRGDLTVHQTDLAAIGSAAHDLFQEFGRYSDHARLASMKAAGGLKSQGFALGSALTTSDYPSGLDKTDVVRFLTQVSHDASGRAAIRYGESIYTDSLLEAHMADPSLFHGSRTQVIHDIAYNSGMIKGIVGRAVADSDVASSLEMEKQDNDAMAQQGEVFKAFLAAGVGVGAVALCPEGKFAEMGAGAGGGFFGQVASIAVDSMYDGRQQDSALDASLYRTGQDLSAMQDSVNQQAQWAVQEAMKKHHSDLPSDGVLDLVRNATNDGWRDSDGIMEDVEKRPSA
ncbi:hypothetical protein [Streptomyces collinus]|uniref:hypothetical protein n=1 Tax=Streptomyces collinus TaxID=42684 RepID=UPI002943A090|nr:hypothetical protein [Streptomyces collinus]